MGRPAQAVSATFYWTLVVGMAATAYVFRVVFLMSGGSTRLPGALRRALNHVPPAVLAALVLPMFLDPRTTWTAESTARLLAGAVAAAVAARSRSIGLTLAVGMGSLWLLTWLLGRLVG